MILRGIKNRINNLAESLKYFFYYEFRQPKMPKFGIYLNSVRKYYKLCFDSSGLPMRYSRKNLMFHPMYPVYVANEYLKQYEKKASDELKSAICKIIDGAMKYFYEDGKKLVYWYKPNSGIGTWTHQYYSGLTQAHYCLLLQQAANKFDRSDWLYMAKKIFNSLLIPYDEGGIYHKDGDIISIEEVPTTPPSIILNGWLSILDDIKNYYYISGDIEAEDLLRKSLNSLEKLLPLYDAESIRNSYYSLLGNLKIRIYSDKKIIFNRISIIQLGLKTELKIGREVQWEHVIYSGTEAIDSSKFSGEDIYLNFVISRLCIEKKQLPKIIIEIDGEINSKVKISFLNGKFDLRHNNFKNNNWLEVPYEIKNINTNNQIIFSISEDIINKICKPTAFSKKINGKYYNVYHFIHCDKLRKLAKYYDSDILKQYSEKWINYTKEWENMDIYKNVEKSPIVSGD